jgi:sec-independent protein translocase protein TatB
MFDLDIGKMLVFCAVALVVVGPKDLPRVFRVAGQILAKAKRFRNDLGTAVTRFADEADLGSIDKGLTTVASSARASFTLDPAMTMRGLAPVSSVDAPGERDRDDRAAQYSSPEMAAYIEPAMLAQSAERRHEPSALAGRAA